VGSVYFLTKFLQVFYILEDNVDVNWTFIFVFKNVTRHFGFEVEREMKFLKHTHWLWAPLYVVDISR
jgi:hypothetical protein